MTETTNTAPTVKLMSKEVRITFPTGSIFSVRLGDLWELMRVLYIAATPRCTVPERGVTSDATLGDELWARFFTAAPARQRRSVERYSGVKKA
jgi:hypothetical protein